MESSLREFRNSFEESLRTKNPPSPTLMLHVENKPSSHWCARWCQFTSSRPLAAGPVDLGRTVSPGPGLSQGPCLPPLGQTGPGQAAASPTTSRGARLRGQPVSNGITQADGASAIRGSLRLIRQQSPRPVGLLYPRCQAGPGTSGSATARVGPVARQENIIRVKEIDMQSIPIQEGGWSGESYMTPQG